MSKEALKLTSQVFREVFNDKKIDFKESSDINKYLGSVKDELPSGDVYNEFFTEFLNKIVRQKVLDTITSKTPIVDKFGIDTNIFGDIEEFSTHGIPAVNQYVEESDLLEVKKGVNFVEYIKTQQKYKIKESVSKSIINGAFLSEQGSNSLFQLIVKHMGDAKSKQRYEDLRTNLTDGISIEVMLEEDEIIQTDSRTGFKNYNGVVKGIERIQKEMEFWSIDYNEIGSENALPQKDQVVVMNINTYKRIKNFTSATLLKGDVLKNILILNEGVEDDEFILIDKNRFVISNRIVDSNSFYDGSNMVYQLNLHNWLRYGHVRFLNGVKITQYVEPEPPEGGTGEVKVKFLTKPEIKYGTFKSASEEILNPSLSKKLIAKINEANKKVVEKHTKTMKFTKQKDGKILKEWV